MRCSNTTFVALKETRLDLPKSIRPDVIIRCAAGVKFDYRELKPAGKCIELLYIDKVRVAEHATFGISLADKT